jgi:hypothetical protein
VTTRAAPRLLVAAGPDRPGARDAILRATEAGASVMLTGEGLAWVRDAHLLARARAGAASLALCSRSARDRKVNPVVVPPEIRWSSLTTWFADLPPEAPLWALLP